MAMAPQRVVSVVDDDAAVRESLTSLLRSLGFAARAFVSAEAFLDSGQARATQCLLLDLRMPGMSGLDLQQALAAEGAGTPIVFVTAHGDDEARCRALAAGAVEFLTKPFSERALLDAVRAAIGRGRPHPEAG